MKTKFTPLRFCLVAAWLITTIATLRAATLTVTNTADSGAGTLRAALASATNGDTINFALPTPAKITLTSAELLVSNSVNILGPGANNLAVDGQFARRVFHITPPNVVTISDLTIANGRSDYGGGVFNDGQLVLIGCQINGNTSFSFTGGGAGICNSNGILAMTNCTVSGNYAIENGGGIFNYSYGTTSTSIVQIASSIISGNHATGGGGIMNSSQGGHVSLVLIRSSVKGNYGDNGGGIENAAGGSGPGIYASATLTVLESLISDNSGGYGSGLGIGFGFGLVDVAITNSTISGNLIPPLAATGYPTDGLYIFGIRGTGTVSIVNSTFTNDIYADTDNSPSSVLRLR